MPDIKSVCVYCGAASKIDPHFHDLARATGELVAKQGWTLIYGGSRTGTMGSVADGALEANGRVVGYIPRHLEEREQQHTGITECHVVDTMHTRKMAMVNAADAFVILPGGFGTLDEFFEILTWRQIGLHDKAIIIVNDGGFWQPLIDLIKNLLQNGFIQQANLELFQVVDRIEDIPDALKRAAEVRFDVNSKWA